MSSFAAHAAAAGEPRPRPAAPTGAKSTSRGVRGVADRTAARAASSEAPPKATAGK